MLLRVVMVLVCGCCPRHADRECCAVLAMLLLVVMVLVCWCCPRHADHECCAVWAMLRRCSPPHSTHSTPPPLTVPKDGVCQCLPTTPTHQGLPPAYWTKRPPTYPPTGPTGSTGDLPPGALLLSRRMLDARAHFKIAAAKMVRHQASWAAWRVGSYAGSSLGPMAPHSTRWYTWLTAAKKTQSSMEHGTVHGNLGNGTKAQRRRMPKTRELLEDGQYSVYTRG
jgi:hypothetical protein